MRTNLSFRPKPPPLPPEAAASESKKRVPEGGAPFDDTLSAETRLVPSQPLGGKLRAFSARFPERDRVDPHVRMLSWFQRSPASVIPHVCCSPEGIMF